MSLTPSLAVFRHRGYRWYWVMRQLVSAARQMMAVAIGWQVYDLARTTRSVEEAAFILGLVGLTQFTPVLFLSLIGGQLADRFNRRHILIVAFCVRIIAVIGLIFSVFINPAYALPLVFAMAALQGVVNAFIPSASHSLFPLLVPKEDLPIAIAWNSLGFQGAAILGPAIGGFLYVLGPQIVYSVGGVMTLCAVLAISIAPIPKHEPKETSDGLTLVKEGLRFVRGNKMVLGSISLDLVVVLFAGATALLPVFARDILETGTGGLGLLRAAPAIGAAGVAFMFAVRPMTKNVGPWLFGAIAVYGAAMLTFGLSPWFWLSMVALAVSGGADMISVYLRDALLLLSTPENMRGRVTSVSFIFISASNELGEFESGIAARLLGPVGAVVFGGVAAIATSGIWIKLFPPLWQADRLDDIDQRA